MLDPAAQTRNHVLSAAAPLAGAPLSPSEAPPPDLLLIERSRGGDDHAIEALIRRYSRRLYRTAWSVLLDAGRAEEAVQEACLAAFADLSRYEAPGRFGAWLTRLAYNQARALRQPLQAGTPATEAAPRYELEEALAALPEAFRSVFILRVVEGISGSETAASLGLHQTTVRTRLYRAHRRIAAGVAQRLAQSSGLLEPSAPFVERLVRRAPARLTQGPVLTTSAART
jgi:RNA polymerase sigma-70 factor, ECF subfamily